MSHIIDYPPSVELAVRPTPLHTLERLSERLGVELLCKRDDLTGAALSGNKVRKLEFLIADACRRGCDGVITTGGQQSNHARATAVAAASVGLKCHLVLRTADPADPPPPGGNILLDRMVGATISWITPEQYAQRDAIMASEAGRLERDGQGRYAVIPEGGSNALGALGYVRCVEELSEQLGRRPATVICAVGSGGTLAGLLAGVRLLQLPYRVVGVCVCDDRAYFQQHVANILAEMADVYHVDVATPADQIEIWEDYVGRGYALSTDEELRLILDVARLEGLITDPVYSGKAMRALITELERGRDLPQPVVFLHTGGVFGLFAAQEQLAPLL